MINGITESTHGYHVNVDGKCIQTCETREDAEKWLCSAVRLHYGASKTAQALEIGLEVLAQREAMPKNCRWLTPCEHEAVHLPTEAQRRFYKEVGA